MFRAHDAREFSQNALRSNGRVAARAPKFSPFLKKYQTEIVQKAFSFSSLYLQRRT